jgi:hypothetical protein
VFEFIQETMPFHSTATQRPVLSSNPVSKPRHTPPDPNDHNNVKTTRLDKNENSDTDEATWNRTDNSAQNEATNENDSQTGQTSKENCTEGGNQFRQ